MTEIYSVSQLNAAARHLLESRLGQLFLTGEISNLTQHVSGHWYFTLKDENAQVSAAMFRMKNQRVTFRPQNGMQVLVRANVSLYEPRGNYQLIIETMQMAGEGLLQQQFEALKAKLSAEGLFAPHWKKSLPPFPKAIGIVTSSTGAALHDILNVLARRDPSLKVVIYPTAVQGKEATREIIQMIELANARREVDVLIVGRGGGSLEDLWCFNEESLARAIFHSTLPIISAVGHEVDMTIADFVADVRAPTPSAAAELVSRNQQELLEKLTSRQTHLEMAFDRIFNKKSQQLQQLTHRLKQNHPQYRLQIQQARLNQLRQHLIFIAQSRLEKTQGNFTALNARLWQNPLPMQIKNQSAQINQLMTQSRLLLLRQLEKTQGNFAALNARLWQNPLPMQIKNQQNQLNQWQKQLIFSINSQSREKQQALSMWCGKLDSLSPLKVLARGYAITQNQQGQPITSAKKLQIGDKIITKFADGQLMSQVLTRELDI